MAALKNVFGNNIKKYSGTFHHKAGNDHVHFLAMSEAPKTKSAVKARIAASMTPIFGTETGFVEVKLFNELKADAGPARGLKGLGDYRSLYVDNNDHANHRPEADVLGRGTRMASCQSVKGRIGQNLKPPGVPLFTRATLLQHIMTVVCCLPNLLSILLVLPETMLCCSWRDLPLTEPSLSPAGPDQGFGLPCCHLNLKLMFQPSKFDHSLRATHECHS